MARVSEATKAEHRRRLLDAAAAEFAAKGLDGARVDDISVAAGLAKGTIYNYFPSKGDVFREVIAAWFARVADTGVALAEDEPVEEQLLSLAVAEVEVIGQQEEFARVAFREVLQADRDEAAELLPRSDPIDDAVVAVIERGQAGGELRTDRSAAELATLYSALMTGLLFEHWLPDARIGLDDIPALLVDHFLRGARA